jgi:hypothetical protein
MYIYVYIYMHIYTGGSNYVPESASGGVVGIGYIYICMIYFIYTCVYVYI